jgi:hypothetical protein
MHVALPYRLPTKVLPNPLGTLVARLALAFDARLAEVPPALLEGL